MEDNMSTSDFSQCSNGTTKRCVRHHHRSKHHHHHTSQSGTPSIASSRINSTCPSKLSTITTDQSLCSDSSSISLIQPFTSFTHRSASSQRKKPSCPEKLSSTGSTRFPAVSCSQPTASLKETPAISVQKYASSVKASASVNEPLCPVQPPVTMAQQTAGSMEPSAPPATPSATSMQPNILRVVDSCTLSIQSNTLDLLLAMDREQDRMVRELSDRMRSIQVDHEMLMALERFGEEGGDIQAGEGGWTMQLAGATEDPHRATRGGQIRFGRLNQLDSVQPRHVNDEPENTRLLLGVPIRPNRINQSDVDQTGDTKKKFLVLADSPFCHRLGTPRLMFAWPDPYPPTRPLTLRAVSTLLRLTAHALHSLALLHLYPCTEYDRTLALPWHLPPLPPPRRQEYSIIEPTWGEEAQA